MISSFQVLVPFSIKVGEAFEVIVLALDSQGLVVTSDSSTLVEISSVDNALRYDASDNQTYTQSDTKKVLTRGRATFKVKDTKSNFLRVFADNLPQHNPPTLMGETFIEYAFNSIFAVTFDVTPTAQGLGTHPRFFESRDTRVLTPVLTLLPQGTSDPTLLPLRQYLTVTVLP